MTYDTHISLIPTALLPAAELQRHLHSVAAVKPADSLNVRKDGGHMT